MTLLFIAKTNSAGPIKAVSEPSIIATPSVIMRYPR